MEVRVEAFYRQSGWSEAKAELIDESQVDYILLGERELTLGGIPDLFGFPLVYQEGSIRIYSTQEHP